MAKTMKLRRPTKGMMMAVNAAIDCHIKEVDQLVREFKLDRKELQTRLEMRAGEKYDMERGKGPRGPRGAKTARTVVDDVVSSLDGRTKTATLVRLESRVQELLSQKPKAEVTKTRDALKNVDKLREQLEAAETLLGL